MKRVFLTLFGFACVMSIATLFSCGDDDVTTTTNQDSGGGDGGEGEGGVGEGATDAPVASGAFYKSGTRLRAQLVKGDGDAVFENFIDQVGGASCDFMLTGASGEMRCIPNHFTNVVYLDDQCTQPATVTDDCTTNFYFAVAQRLDPCGGEAQVAEVRPIGDILSATTYHLKTPDGCSSSTIALTQKLRAVGAPRAMTDFVGATSRDEPVGSRLHRLRIVGEDGSELAREAFVDIGRAVTCDPAQVGPAGVATSFPQNLACTPRSAASDDNAYADPVCTKPAGTRFERPGCPPASAMIRYEIPDGGLRCGQGLGIQLFEVGARLDGGFRGPPAACAPNTGANVFFYEKGAEIPASALPPLVRAPAGSGRVRPIFTTVEGTRADRGTLWDDTRKSRCNATRFADGKLRCTSSTVVDPPQRFKDAACTQPIVAVEPCIGEPVVLMGSGVCDAYVLASDVRRTGPALAITEYYDMAGAGCSPTPTPLPAGSVAHDVLTAEPAGNVFPEVVRSQE